MTKMTVVMCQMKNATRMKENAGYSNALMKEHLLLSKLDKMIKIKDLECSIHHPMKMCMKSLFEMKIL